MFLSRLCEIHFINCQLKAPNRVECCHFCPNVHKACPQMYTSTISCWQNFSHSPASMKVWFTFLLQGCCQGVMERNLNFINKITFFLKDFPPSNIASRSRRTEKITKRTNNKISLGLWQWTIALNFLWREPRERRGLRVE